MFAWQSGKTLPSTGLSVVQKTPQSYNSCQGGFENVSERILLIYMLVELCTGLFPQLGLLYVFGAVFCTTLDMFLI